MILGLAALACAMSIAARAAPVTKDAVGAAIKGMGSPNAQERADAAARLRDLSDAQAAIPSLIKLLADVTPTRATRENALASQGRIFPSPGFEAAQTLAEMGGAVLDPLAVAARSPDAATRERAVWALRNWRDPRGAVLVDAIADADPNIRALAAGGLGQAVGVNPLGTLLDAVKDENASVRRAAVGALGNLPHAPLAADAIIRLLKNDPESNVRETAATALGNSGDPRAHDLLVAALDGKDEGVRATAIQMLGLMHDARAVQPLIGLLSDKAPRVRMDAVSSLGQIKDARAVAPLVALIEDEDERVRMGAMDALGKITGQPATTDAAQWRKWWDENKTRYSARPVERKNAAQPGP